MRPLNTARVLLASGSREAKDEATGKLGSAGEAGAAARSTGLRMKAADGTWAVRGRSTMRADCGRDGSSAFPVADRFAFRDKETKTEAR
jgi:hypothetical protein